MTRALHYAYLHGRAKSCLTTAKRAARGEVREDAAAYLRMALAWRDTAALHRKGTDR